MEFINHILLGFIMAFIGLLPPGMINMTTVRTAIEHGKVSAIRFATGASLIVLIQASIALYFANYFNNNPQVIEQLAFTGGLVFLLLAIFFYWQGRKKFKASGKKQKGNFLVTGMVMSSLNMLSIPFYLGWSTFLSLKGYVQLMQPHIWFFVIGASTGAFTLFILYSTFATIIERRAQFIASNINFILSGLFVILGMATLYNTW